MSYMVLTGGGEKHALGKGTLAITGNEMKLTFSCPASGFGPLTLVYTAKATTFEFLLKGNGDLSRYLKQ